MPSCAERYHRTALQSGCDDELGDDYLRDYVQRIWAVTPADVQRIAATYLDPKKMTIVVAGDRKQIDAQLQPWNAAPGGKPKAKRAP